MKPQTNQPIQMVETTESKKDTEEKISKKH